MKGICVLLLLAASLGTTIARAMCADGSCELPANTTDQFLEDEEEDVSFLSLESTTGTGDRYCRWQGDTHMYTNMNGASNNDVMGETEWIALESGAKAPSTDPYFMVQITQKVWQSSGCQARNVHITVAKDVAIKCGDMYMMFQGPMATSGASSCGANAIFPATEYTRYFVKGNRDDGVSFNWEWMSATTGTYRFNLEDGHQARLVIHTLNSNCQDETGCPKGTSQNSAGNFDFYCADDTSYKGRVDYNTNGNINSGTHANVYIYIPESSQASNTPMANGQIVNGFCGGWPSSGTAKNNFNSCKGGTKFYSTSCYDKFGTKDYNSIFRKFASGTRAATTDSRVWYSSIKYGDAAPGTPEDPTMLAEKRAACLVQRRTIDNRDDSQLDLSLSYDNMLLSLLTDCATDAYFGMDWGVTDWTNSLCHLVQALIDAERRDIRCAHHKYTQLAIADSTISTSGMEGASNTDLEDKIRLIRAYVSEIESSKGNIDAWDADGTCTFADTDFSLTNCDTHAFKNTLLQENNINTIA